MVINCFTCFIHDLLTIKKFIETSSNSKITPFFNIIR